MNYDCIAKQAEYDLRVLDRNWQESMSNDEYYKESQRLSDLITHAKDMYQKQVHEERIKEMTTVLPEKDWERFKQQLYLARINYGEFMFNGSDKTNAKKLLLSLSDACLELIHSDLFDEVHEDEETDVDPDVIG